MTGQLTWGLGASRTDNAAQMLDYFHFHPRCLLVQSLHQLAADAISKLHITNQRQRLPAEYCSTPSLITPPFHAARRLASSFSISISLTEYKPPSGK